MSSHLLYPKLSDPDIRALQTAVFFALIHGLSLVFLPALREFGRNQIRVLSIMWVFGILAFSISIVLLKTSIALSWGTLEWLSPLTPFGGAALILSWLYFSVLFLIRKKEM